MAAQLHNVIEAGPYEYLAITGRKIPGIKFAKKAIILPGQRYRRYIVCPVFHRLEVEAITADKLRFMLPADFTVEPNVNSEDALVRYTNLVNWYREKSFIEGIIKLEIQELARSMTMEEIVFEGSKDFKKKVFDKVELALKKFGLVIYYHNFKQLVDVSGHGYFSTKVEAEAEADNWAKIDVSEARTEGDAAKIDAVTTTIMSESNL